MAMKKLFAILLGCLMVLPMAACGQAKTDQLTPEQVLKKLQNHLPQNVMENLPEFSEMDDLEGMENGEVLYYWRKKLDETNDVTHKVEVELNSDGAVQRFSYKSYFFEPEGNPVTQDEALALVQAFAVDFIAEAETLTFQNKTLPNHTLYDSGNVEPWVAIEGEKAHVIFVNLRLGYVTHYSVDNASFYMN